MPDDSNLSEAGQVSFKDKLVGLFEVVFATRIQSTERLATDPVNIYIDDVSNRRPRMVALALALLLHILLFIMYWPQLTRDLIISDKIIKLSALARPAGGGPPEPKVQPPEPKKEVTPDPKPRLMPIPDPTPQDPDPIINTDAIEIAKVVDRATIDFNIGDISGPTGHGTNGRGQGRGSSDGPGDSDGLDGVYQIGGGVRQPVLIKQTLPSYTDDAIKAKVQGTVLLQVVVRKDGSVDNFRVIKALGYGLDEKAIEEIANNWVFRPGTKDGVPVDVLATIEVSFTLR